MPVGPLLIVWTTVVWLVALDLHMASQAGAAKVDAIGAPAPICFADVVEGPA
jgi:hypothetical protein